jgi:DNA (cytosine-5)-methyltransferase 1
MGEISKTDIYHSFKKYTSTMQSWIQNLKEGESAFDNKRLK